MSIAAEHVADRQRLRERLRAVSLETTLAVSGLVAIVVRVLDGNFIQPQPRTSPLDYRVSGPVPAAVVSAAAAQSSSSRTAKKVAQQLTPTV